MTASAVQSFLKDTLQGVTAPDFEAATVYIAPPQADTLENASPVIFVWGYRDHEQRRTFPRRQAFRTTEYEMYLWIKALFQGGSPREDVAFPLLLDAIKQVLRDVTLGVQITDPDTEQVSNLQSVGEDFRTEYPGPRDVSPENMRLYEATISAQIVEDFRG